jgi:fibrillarin-like rRNA methylase
MNTTTPKDITEINVIELVDCVYLDVGKHLQNNIFMRNLTIIKFEI